MWPFKRANDPDPYDQIFADTDFDFVRVELMSMFVGEVLPSDLEELLAAYADNPCRETAIRLIEFDSQLGLLFIDSGQRRRLRERLGEDVSRPRVSARLLAECKPELFEEFCLSMAESKTRHEELKQELIGQGYTEKELANALSEYWINIGKGYPE